MVKICQRGLLKLNFETRPKKRIFWFLPKISAGHGRSRKIFFANFQILGPLGCQGWVVIPQNVKKKSKSLHPTVQAYSQYNKTKRGGCAVLNMPFFSRKIGRGFITWLFFETLDCSPPPPIALSAILAHCQKYKSAL